MLDHAALSQRVISSNIANVGTPGYEVRAVSFNERIKDVLDRGEKMTRTSDRHMPNPNWWKTLKPEIKKVATWEGDSPDGSGINDVNIDQEMVELAKAQLDFNMGSRLLQQRFDQLQTAIRGRR
jgi:flagellar basal-body rod protein FlgB